MGLYHSPWKAVHSIPDWRWNRRKRHGCDEGGGQGPELSGIPLAFITTRFPLYFVGLFASYAAGFIVCRLMGFTDPED